MLDDLRALLLSPHVVDGVLGVLAIEVGLLALWARRRGKRLSLVLGQVGAGFFLLLGLRAVLAGADPLWLALCLMASLPAHLWDVRQRLFS